MSRITKSLHQASKEISKSKSYFKSLESKNKTIIRYMIFIGKGDIARGYHLLIEEREKNLQKIQDTYFTYDNKADLARILLKHKIVTNMEYANNYVNSRIFMRSEYLNLRTIKIHKKILKAIAIENAS